MREAIDEVLARTGRVTTRARLLTAVTQGEFDDEVRRGHLVRVFPHTYCRPWDADDPGLADRAALTCVGPPAVLSHLSALRRWGVPVAELSSVHVSIPYRRSARRHQGITVHRTRHLPSAARADGLPSALPAEAVIDSWPLLGDDRRAPAIAATRARLVTPAELAVRLATRPRLPGRHELATLVGLLEAGCESELEIWGCLQVFDVPGLRHGYRQRWISVGDRRYRADLAFDAERVIVEMDGDRFHSTPDQRERDRRRDAALAAAGWLTLRFSWHRLHHDVAGCRRETLATLRSRRP